MRTDAVSASALALVLMLSGTAHADTSHHERDDDRARTDFGVYRDRLLQARSMELFGVRAPLESSSTRSVDAATAEADPLRLASFAGDLHARVVASHAGLGRNIDMMTLWPAQHPTHLIVCNERDPSRPGLQRVRLSDGEVETILTGTQSCDPAHATPWGTVVIGEEAGNSGTVLEIIDPLHTTGVVYDRGTQSLSGADADHVAVRPAVGHLSFEGVAVYPNGVLYYGDENRPSEGTAGGAYFKFVPASPWAGGAPIGDLSESPLVSGTVYGLRLGKRHGGTDYGQGSNTGLGNWVMVPNAYDADLRAAAANLKLTGYYRPEDIAIDGHALAQGQVRFCGNNTGNEGDGRNWGETICVTDGALAEASANTATPEVQLFATGTRQFAMMDNIAWQPGRGNWVIHEDGDAPGVAVNPHNNDLWSCLEDGQDVDTLSDGCVRIATLNDLNAEWTGGLFDARGERFYVSVQHNVTGHGTILEVTGWR